MVNVEFETEGKVVATLAVSGAGIERVVDPEDVIDFSAVTFGVHTGKRVAFADDPEEWARSLPRLYRNVYLRAVVIGDDNPLRRQEQEPAVIDDRRLVPA